MNPHLVCAGGKPHCQRSLTSGVLEFIGVEEKHSWKLPLRQAVFSPRLISNSTPITDSRMLRPLVEGLSREVDGSTRSPD